MTQKLPDDAPATMGDLREMRREMDALKAQVEALEAELASTQYGLGVVDERTIGSMRLG